MDNLSPHPARSFDGLCVPSPFRVNTLFACASSSGFARFRSPFFWLRLSCHRPRTTMCLQFVVQSIADMPRA